MRIMLPVHLNKARAQAFTLGCKAHTVQSLAMLQHLAPLVQPLACRNTLPDVAVADETPAPATNELAMPSIVMWGPEPPLQQAKIWGKNKPDWLFADVRPRATAVVPTAALQTTIP